MKKLFAILIVTIFFAACSGNNENSAVSVSATDSAKSMIDSATNTIKVAADTTKTTDTTKSK
jgi:PBP1b-binding outer membrane lipoprotein LpoB